MFDSHVIHMTTLHFLTTRQNVTVHHVSIQLGIPLRPARDVLSDLQSRGYVTSQVSLNLSGPKSEHHARTLWTITPLGRMALAQAMRDSRVSV